MSAGNAAVFADDVVAGGFEENAVVIVARSDPRESKAVWYSFIVGCICCEVKFDRNDNQHVSTIFYVFER